MPGPRGAEVEDDGYLLGMYFDAELERSCLVVCSPFKPSSQCELTWVNLRFTAGLAFCARQHLQVNDQWDFLWRPNAAARAAGRAGSRSASPIKAHNSCRPLVGRPKPQPSVVVCHLSNWAAACALAGLVPYSFRLVPDVLDVTHFARFRYICVRCWWKGKRRLVQRQDIAVGVPSACESGRRLIA